MIAGYDTENSPIFIDLCLLHLNPPAICQFTDKSISIAEVVLSVLYTFAAAIINKGQGKVSVIALHIGTCADHTG